MADFTFLARWAKIAKGLLGKPNIDTVGEFQRL
jgi:hypothetical protein